MSEIKKVKRKAGLSEDEILQSSAKLASSKAVRSSLALGLTIKVLDKGKIIEINSKGQKVIGTHKKTKIVDLSKLRKGVKLKRNKIA